MLTTTKTLSTHYTVASFGIYFALFHLRGNYAY